MTQIGKVVGVWRYPVKGMRGEELREGFLSFAGVYGDRLYAFRSPAAPPGFPYHTAREQEDLLLYQPKFRQNGVTKPPNLDEACAMAPGITPVFADRAAFAVEVTGSDGSTVPIESPALLEDVRNSRDDGGDVALAFSERPMMIAGLSPSSTSRPRSSSARSSTSRSTSGGFAPTFTSSSTNARVLRRTRRSAELCSSATRPWSPFSSAIRDAR